MLQVDDEEIRRCMDLLASTAGGPAQEIHCVVAANRLWKISCESAFWAERIGVLGALRCLVELAAQTRSVLAVGEVLGCIWNCSAYTRNKPLLVELGIVAVLPQLLARFPAEARVEECVSAILQNVSESRFRTGERNPYQVRIAEEGGLALAAALCSPPRDLETRLRAALTLANLAMHPENARAMERTGAAGLVERAVEEGREERLRDFFGSWLSLMPFVPLLEAPLPAARLLAAFSLSRLALKPRYRRLLWRAMALCNGVAPLRALAADPDERAATLANRVLLTLRIPGLMRAGPAPEGTLSRDMLALLRSGDGADVVLLAGGRSFPAHRAILAARCPALAARFSTGAAMAGGPAADLRSDLSESALEAVLEHVYGGGARLAPETAAEVLQAADLLQLAELKAAAEEYVAESVQEESVWGLLAAADLYSAPRLRAACLAFAARHVGRESLEAHLGELDPRTAADLRAAREAVEAEARAGGAGRARRRGRDRWGDDAAELLGPTQGAAGGGALEAHGRAAGRVLSAREAALLAEREESEEEERGAGRRRRGSRRRRGGGAALDEAFHEAADVLSSQGSPGPRPRPGRGPRRGPRRHALPGAHGPPAAGPGTPPRTTEPPPAAVL
eukprot:tig00000769_g4029.t1